MIITVGIDPGKSGAIAVVADGAQVLVANNVPTAGKNYLPAQMAALLLPFAALWRERDAPLRLLHTYTDLLDAVKNPDMPEEEFEQVYTWSEVALAAYMQQDDRAVLAMVEKQRGRKGEGPERLVQIGKGWGLWEGICATLCIPYEEVSGPKWERAMGCSTAASVSLTQKAGEEDKAFDKREKAAKAKAQRDKKHSHVAQAQALFPDCLIKASDDGLADALLLAVYAFRTYQGREQ